MAAFNLTQIIVSIVVAFGAGVVVGKLHQIAVSSWRTWRTVKATVPGLRSNAFSHAGNFVIKLGLAVLVVGAVALAAFARGQG